jgi:hypothetical protein
VGAGVWTVSNLTITVWGDDATTAGTDGLAAGEPYVFRLWKSETDIECGAAATYSMGESGYAPNALVVIASLMGTAETPEPPDPVHFDPTAPTGSSATISIPLAASPAIDDQPLVTGDEIAVFDPRGLCVGAGVWTVSNLTITVWGDDATTAGTDGLAAGEPYAFRLWRSETDIECEAAATYSMGESGYAPNALVVLASLAGTAETPEPPELLHFDPAAPTGSSATISIPLTAHPAIDDQPLVTGDEIAVFDPRGLCVGAGVWQEADLTITVYGDNTATTETDGMIAGETYAFRVWVAGTNKEYEAATTYSSGDSTYVPGAHVVIASIIDVTISPEPEPSAMTEPRVFPNPFKATTTIIFSNAKQEQVTISILTITGQCIQIFKPGVLEPGEHMLTFNGIGMPPGVYLIRVEAGKDMKTGRALLLR